MQTNEVITVTRNLKGRHLLSLHDWTRPELEQILNLAAAFKQRDRHDPLLAGKTLGLLFAKPSSRTRIAYEVAMARLGGQTIHIAARDDDRGESIADAARTMSRYLNGIAIRTYEQRHAEELAAHASVPVINALTGLLHPCEILADLLTIRERLGALEGVKLCYVGEGNNICNTLLQGGSKFGLHVTVACPPGYGPDPEVLRQVKVEGARVDIGTDPQEAATGADIIYTDAWSSMGNDRSREERLRIFAPYQVNAALMRLAKPGALFLHCLPARRGEEVTDDVLDGAQSIAGAASEQVRYVQQAALALLMG